MIYIKMLLGFIIGALISVWIIIPVFSWPNFVYKYGPVVSDKGITCYVADLHHRSFFNTSYFVENQLRCDLGKKTLSYSSNTNAQ